MKNIKKRKGPLNLGDYIDFVSEFHRETDRAAGILAGAFVENTLQSFLKAFLRKDPLTVKLFEGLEPLATFSARAKFCYVLGLITKTTLSDLDIIRGIRNHFAHHPLGTSFSDPDVMHLCSQFSMARMVGAKDARDIYLIATGMIVLRINNARNEQERSLTEAMASKLPISPTASVREFL